MKQYWIVVNTECNMRCKHCFETNFNKGKVSIDDVKVFLSKLTRNTSINLFGGEPTLDMEHLLEILKLLKEHPLVDSAVIFSNGRFDFNKYESELLVYKDFVHWQISIQAVKNRNSKIKSETPTLEWFIEKGFSFIISTVVVVGEEKEIKSLSEYLFSKGLSHKWHLAPNRMEKDMDALKESLLNIMRILVDDATKTGSIEYYPPFMDRIFNNTNCGCSAFQHTGVARYSTMGIDGKMYGCHHASNITSDNNSKEDILNNAIHVSEWNDMNSEYMCASKPLHKLNGVMSCPMECDGCEHMYDESELMIRSLKLEMKGYIRERLSDMNLIKRGDE